MKKAEYIAKMGAMLSLVCALSFIESRVCSFFPHGIRIGLANIVIMLAVFSHSIKSAFILSFLKSAFVLCTRGPIAFFMSFCGGIISVAIVTLTSHSKRASVMLCSVFGAISHNLAQLCVCAFITKSAYIFFYSPVLILSGIGAGIVTGLCLGALAPRLFQSKQAKQKIAGRSFVDDKKTRWNQASSSEGNPDFGNNYTEHT